jgi:tetratricopeptide (TPR) repeat protein
MLQNRFALIPLLALFLGSLLYLPGLNGPYLFDDYTNLLGNAYVRVTSLDLSSLYQAAFSMSAGPLQRPVAMVSFAINHYVAGGFDNVAAFKLVNLAIHFLNGALVYWFTYLILGELLPTKENKTKHTRVLYAAAVSLLWILHPIQLSTVLYVVQRMTELAGTFTLLALIAYVKGRLYLREKRWPHATISFVLALGVFWPLGMYSKEIALLVPVFAFVIDYVVFQRDRPWKTWRELSRKTQYILLACLALFAVLTLIAVIAYALPGYALRNFTMMERVLTQPRVLFFYLSLILVPRLDAFGLFHDDMQISSGLLTPWTTVPAIVGIAILPIVAFVARRKFPLLSVGILWFLAGHLLESSVFSLEMVYEHRNYLPSLGILFVMLEGFRQLRAHFRPALLRGTVALVFVGFGAITVARATQWSSESDMAYYEAMHHPDSPASQSRYASLLLNEGRLGESLVIAQRAAQLSPNEPSYLMGIVAVVVSRGGKVENSELDAIDRLLASRPISASTLYEVSEISNCVTRTCPQMQPYLQRWTRAMLRNPGKKDVSYSYFLLGRALLGQNMADEAIEAYRRSYELDNNFIHPLLDMVELYLYYGRPDYAEVVLAQIKTVNERSVHKRDSEIARLSEKISRQKQNAPKHAPR